MPFVDLVYLVFITLAMYATYFVLLFLLPLFFGQKITTPRKKLLLPLLYIVIFSVLAYAVSYSVQDIELANRILHIFGGSFLGFFVCFLAARNSEVHINKFQFFVFSVLIVLALGIANELLEFVMQEYIGLISATSITDTWLDLVSNVIGVIFASICLVPFHRKITSSPLDHI
ncbi:MAG: hypothetical protein V1711_02445 [bacterium]